MKSKIKLLYLLVFTLCLFYMSSPSKAAASMVSYWKFDDGSGSHPVDSGGNNITGNFTGTTPPTWSTDTPPVSFSDPYSLDFTGTGDGVYFNWPSGLNFNSTDNRSFSFWFKPVGDGENASGKFDRIMSWTGDKFEIAGTLGDVTVHRLAFYDGSWRDTGYDLTPGTWYHITFTYDGTNVKLYVGNDLKFSGTSAGRDISGTVYIGLRYTGDEGINGLIDDFRIYNNALTFDQVSNLTAGSSDPDVSATTPAPQVTSHVPFPPPVTPEGGEFKIWLNNNDTTTTSSKVKFFSNALDDVVLVKLSNNESMANAGLYPYSPGMDWDICSDKNPCSLGNHVVYAQLINKYGLNTPVLSANIQLVLKQTALTNDLNNASSTPQYASSTPPLVTPALPSGLTWNEIFKPQASIQINQNLETPFSKDLQFGDVNKDVQMLQEFLNGNGFILTQSPIAGAKGKETKNFLKLTYNALFKFQKYYQKQIGHLPNGIFDLSTRKVANEIFNK